MKIISGGQTGVDQLGLIVARSLKIETGGWAPKYWMTDEGAQKELLESFGLKEHWIVGYPPRTEQNVIDSEFTLIFGNANSAGCKLTISLCKERVRPYRINPTSAQIKALRLLGVSVFNIAGNRRKNLSDDQYFEIARVLTEGFGNISVAERSPENQLKLL